MYPLGTYILNIRFFDFLFVFQLPALSINLRQLKQELNFGFKCFKLALKPMVQVSVNHLPLTLILSIQSTPSLSFNDNF